MDQQNEHIEFTVSPEETGMRIDKCIAVRLGESYSRTYVKFLIDNDLVTEVSANGVLSVIEASRVFRVGSVLPPASPISILLNALKPPVLSPLIACANNSLPPSVIVMPNPPCIG